MAVRNLKLLDLRKMALGSLDEEVNDNHYGSLVASWINEGMQRMITESEGLEDNYTFSTVVGTRDYALPAPPTIAGDIIRLKQVLYEGRAIAESQLLNYDFFSNGTGYVDRFAIWNNKILFGPMRPSKVVPVILYFYRSPAVLVADGDTPEIPDRFRGYLADYAAAQMLLADGRGAEASVFMQSFDQGARTYNHWARQKSRSNFKQVLQVME